MLSLVLVSGASSMIDAQAVRAVRYPYAVKHFDLQIENRPARMAYMDASPTAKSNGETVILFHGKNFNGFYWKDVVPKLTANGYRVIIPDQIGWGKSDKPKVHYSFHLLAANNKKLLELLKIERVIVVGHSMGGMLATRFALMFPETISKLVLENPIGLEDYRTFVPYASFEDLLKSEKSQTYDSMKKYQQTYYPVWKSEYEQYARAQAESLIKPDFAQTAVAGALTSLMIYEQPVIYEFKNLKVPTLLIIGQEDRTVVGKNRLSKELQNKHGQYPELGKQINREISGSKLIELSGVGHIPHVQTLDKFIDAMLEFIKQ
ncbi:MAG: alpha/beta hydrolase [Pyrinomonadaceae bacterium]